MGANTASKRAEGGVSVRVVGGIVVAIAALLALYAFTLAERIDEAQTELAACERSNVECVKAISDLQTASDYLTAQARSFVVTGRRENLEGYVTELEVTNRRGKALEVIRESFPTDDATYQALAQALDASDALARTELAAMKLAAGEYGVRNLPEAVERSGASVFSREGAGKTDLEIATSLVLDENYDNAKATISANVTKSAQALLEELDADLAEVESNVQILLFQLRITVALLLCAIMVLVLTLFMYVLKPLGGYVRRIRANEPLKADGAFELHYLANAYNAMYEDNARHIEQMRSLAERDSLTGIANRSGYDSFLATHTRDIALLLLDIDHFREYNQVYGHDTGDAVLKRLAEALTDAFRSTDFPCRIESDKFAVVMTNMSSDLRDVIVEKVERVNEILHDAAHDLPLVTLSVGAAFSTEGMDDQDIYRAAGDALASAKGDERQSIVFYGEHNAE